MSFKMILGLLIVQLPFALVAFVFIYVAASFFGWPYTLLIIAGGVGLVIFFIACMVIGMELMRRG